MSAVLGVLLALSLSGCTGDPPPAGDRAEPPPSTPSPTTTGEVPSLRERAAPYDIAYRRVAGSLPRAKRARTLRFVTRPVRAWVDAGFVRGPWPRERFRQAIAPFNRGITPRARTDADLLTMRGLGPSLVEVVPRRRRVRVSMTAVRGRAVGATAHLDLRVFAVDDRDRRMRVQVRGDVYLTYVKERGWRIFGYSLDRWVDHAGRRDGGDA